MSNQAESSFPVKLCFWNINGVRNKFLAESVTSLIEDIEILVIVESHFNIRSKCPDNFTLVGRSKPLAAKSPRGGVAIYKNKGSNLIIDIVCDSLPDCVIFELRNSTALFIACYIHQETAPTTAMRTSITYSWPVNYLYPGRTYSS